MKKLLYILLIVLTTLNGYAQFSKTHYIPPITCQEGLAEDHYIYISTPSIENVNFKIIENGGTVIPGTVNNTNPYRYNIGTGDTTPLFTPKTQIGIINNKGYTIEAEDLIYVSVRVNSGLNRNNNSYNHAGGLVSKGNSALGKTFRLGAMTNPLVDGTLLNFASILATENGTKITISNIPDGTVLSDGTIVNGPITATLNKNQSYIIAFENYENSVSNSSKIIGALVESDKPVVVNTGSFAGSNSTVVVTDQNNITYPVGRDIGFDQIVPFEKTGTEYIFVKGLGTDELERVLLISNIPNTIIYLNGNTTPFATLINPGDYITVDGSQFINGNLYVKTSENVFAYQSIGGLELIVNPTNNTSNNPYANQNLFFVPPLNCATPNSVDNIPYIESIGNITFNGGLNIVTETGALVKINGTPITTPPIAVEGNLNFERYSINGLTGNIAVNSTKQVYVSYFGTNGAATYGGYYSGFDTKPEIGTNKLDINNSSCIPNIELKVSAISPFTTFEWYFNDVAIPNSNRNTYTPTQPGYYQVKGSIPGCLSIFSDKIPVSNCATDLDNDLTVDNIDIDNDNDGITNCTESYGNVSLNISNLTNGAISMGNFSDSFTGSVTTSTNKSTIPFLGYSNGSFISEVPIGKNNSVTYKVNFTKPISIGMEYISNANPSDLLNSESEYIINSDIDKTITVLNPTDQLLIDTNYDGIYESGIIQFSSFEIRFRLKNATPLAAGTGTFQFLTYLTKSISFTHINLSDTNSNKTSLRLFAVCLPKDSDNDATPEQLDADSDNDGILDIIELQKNNSINISNIDINKNGLDDIFEPMLTPMDTDKDGVPDYLDLDSDNDGILDTTEKENDIDSDNIPNYRDLDSDNDLCLDVIEAGFTDFDNDGILGIGPVNVTIDGKVIGGTYIPLSNDYTIAARIIITSQPNATPTCELQNTIIPIIANGDSYQWQFSPDGANWSAISDNTIYSGYSSNTLSILGVSKSMNGYKYRVFINKLGNSCGLSSAETTLQIYDLPLLSAINLKQCDDNSDGITDFNLTEKNSFISANYSNETFTYFTTQAAANTNNSNAKINNPTAFRSGNNTVWVRVENSYGCFNVTSINLIVTTTQIPNTFLRTFSTCDDFIDDVNNDIDGVANFDFSSTTVDIVSILPAPVSAYSLKYYKNEADALAETNEITNTTNYRNIGYPNEQQIWARIESTIDNSCYGLGPYVKLIVNTKPKINTNEDHLDNEMVCINLPDFYVKLNAGIIDGTPTTNYTYTWSKDGTIIINKNEPTLDVNAEGIYTVEVKSLFGCVNLRTIKVTGSGIAKIDNIEITDLSESNTVRVNVNGLGTYSYSLDEPNGSFQNSNFFENIPAGFHTVYVNDENGCGIISQTIAIIGIPKFFTPNGDGYNDYWKVKGISSTINSNSSVTIFDRYGKLIQQISSSSIGWDGTMNGHPLPSDDYWYYVKLQDGRELRGHFSLKR